MIIRLWQGLLLVSMLATLSACMKPINVGAEAHEVAIEYFERFYNQRDLQGALALASVEYRPTLERYGSTRAIGRYLYNMNFDEVSIEADRQGVELYRNQADTARVKLSFSGQQREQRVETLRNVVMVRENGEWRLARVL